MKSLLYRLLGMGMAPKYVHHLKVGHQSGYSAVLWTGNLQRDPAMGGYLIHVHMGRPNSKMNRWEYSHTLRVGVGALPSYGCGSVWQGDLYKSNLHDNQQPTRFRVPPQRELFCYTGRGDFDDLHFGANSYYPSCPEANVAFQRLTAYDGNGKEVIVYIPCISILCFYSGGLSSLLTQIIDGGFSSERSDLQIYASDQTYWKGDKLHLMLGRNTSSQAARLVGRIVGNEHLLQSARGFHRHSIAMSQLSQNLTARGLLPLKSDVTVSVLGRRLRSNDGHSYYLVDHIVDYNDNSKPFEIEYASLRDGKTSEEDGPEPPKPVKRHFFRILERIRLYFRRPNAAAPSSTLLVDGLPNMWMGDQRYPCMRLPREVSGTREKCEEEVAEDADALSVGEPDASGVGGNAKIISRPKVKPVDIDCKQLFETLVDRLSAEADAVSTIKYLSPQDLKLFDSRGALVGEARRTPPVEIYLACVRDSDGRVYYLIDGARGGFDAFCFWLYHSADFYYIESYLNIARSIVLNGYSRAPIGKGFAGVICKSFYHSHLPHKSDSTQFENYALHHTKKILAYIKKATTVE